MDWLRVHTKIPVPRVIAAYYRRGDYTEPITEGDPIYCCLIMERMPGETLHEAWDKMARSDHVQILKQLHGHIAELREVVQPPHIQGHVCSFVQGPLDEPALSNFDPVGPFTIPQFIDYLMEVTIRDREAKEERFRHILGRSLQGDPLRNRLHLTHSDLHVHNIIVKKVGGSNSVARKTEWQVTGIIDWTMAGWYPVYWETYKSGYSPHDTRRWREIAPLALGMFKEEVLVLQELQSITFR